MTGGAGHGGETHFRVQMISAEFCGQDVASNATAPSTHFWRMKFAGGVHALALEIKAPGE